MEPHIATVWKLDGNKTDYLQINSGLISFYCYIPRLLNINRRWMFEVLNVLLRKKKNYIFFDILIVLCTGHRQINHRLCGHCAQDNVA